MTSEKPYNSHLCTFMGREANLEILLPYIEGALFNNAVDNYWFIDMTRKRSDHELIKKESARLNELFPGRVHLYNSEERAKIIDDPEKIAEVSSDWSVFYKFLLKFKDNDIIAKCDDDTYFIDIATLAAAFELRWNNKKPFLMHANAINNGVCAYHQNKKGIWKDQETKTYPPGGLSGPLFAHPEVACSHHKKFTQDMIANPANIDKYKLKDNIQFCNRVSINFIFMLGKDRKALSKITRQDEYDTSVKIPQQQNRPNMLIGDFIMAHHTYGNQEPTMEKLKTDQGYKKLKNKLKPATTKVEPLDISTKVNAVSTIGGEGGLLGRSWVESDTYVLRNPENGEFISLSDDIQEAKHGDMLKRKFSRTNNIKEATLFNIKEGKVESIWIENSAHILKCPDEELVKSGKAGLCFPNLGMSGKAMYLTNKVLAKKSGKFMTIKSSLDKSLNLAPKTVPEKMLKERPEDAKKLLSMNHFTRDTEFKWEAISMKDFVNLVIPINIKRCKNKKLSNDCTTASSKIEGLPDLIPSIDFIWNIGQYIWEFIPTKKENTYLIKLIADDKPDLYLSYNKKQDKVLTTSSKDEWIIEKQFLKHRASGKYLNIQNGEVKLLPKKSKLVMCPQK